MKNKDIKEKTTINSILKKYNIVKTNKKSVYWLDKCYDYKIKLKHLKAKWYISIEKPTKKCKFYAIFTRFDNPDILDDINKIIPCNTFSGKCNRFPKNLSELECFINNVITLDKLK